MFVRAASGGVWHVVGLRTGRTASAAEPAIHFGVWVPELEGLRYQAGTHQGRAIKHLGRSFELSPVAPLKNTYWWPSDLAQSGLRDSLRRQLAGIVLPFFDSFERVEAVLAAMLAWEDGASQRSVELLRERCAVDAAAPSVRSEHLTAQLASEMSAEGFTRAGDRLWRTRDGVIDIVIVEPLADHRFVAVYAVVWHESLRAGIDGPIPHGITAVTARQVGPGGAVDPVDCLLRTGDPQQEPVTSPLPGHAATIRALLAHFASVRTAADVLATVPAEYRSHFPA